MTVWYKCVSMDIQVYLCISNLFYHVSSCIYVTTVYNSVLVIYMCTVCMEVLANGWVYTHLWERPIPSGEL